MVSEEQVYEVLRQCYDPEIPVNIVDLGLIYNVAVDSENGEVRVQMTLTAPGCHMGGMISEDVRRRLLNLPGVRDANVELVWDPPWNPGMMSEAARKQLGMG